jgi:hypothetical protein
MYYLIAHQLTSSRRDYPPVGGQVPPVGGQVPPAGGQAGKITADQIPSRMCDTFGIGKYVVLLSLFEY